MKHVEKRIDKYIRFDNDQIHLVESVIRQIIQEGKVAHVIVEAQNETTKRSIQCSDSGQDSGYDCLSMAGYTL